MWITFSFYSKIWFVVTSLWIDILIGIAIISFVILSSSSSSFWSNNNKQSQYNRIEFFFSIFGGDGVIFTIFYYNSRKYFWEASIVEIKNWFRFIYIKWNWRFFFKSNNKIIKNAPKKISKLQKYLEQKSNKNVWKSFSILFLKFKSLWKTTLFEKRNVSLFAYE